MRIGLTILTLLLSACGARVDDNHTGGKTSWLSACSDDGDCTGLMGSVCANRMCTKTCEDVCNLEDTTCAGLVFPSGGSEDYARVCTPDCEQSIDCRSHGRGYQCESGLCVYQGTRVDLSVTAPGIDVDAAGLGNSQDNHVSLADAGSATQQPVAPILSVADGGSTSSNDVDGGNSNTPPNPHNCAATILLPEDRPYQPAVEALGVEPLVGEPACDGPCGYRYHEGAWNFDWRLQCPLLDASSCADITAQLDAITPLCNTLEDCSSYSGSLDRCDAYFAGYENWTSELWTPAQRGLREDLLEQYLAGGCGSVEVATGLTYQPVACREGLCVFESSFPCEQ